jgi:hypothetical protein
MDKESRVEDDAKVKKANTVANPPAMHWIPPMTHESSVLKFAIFLTSKP